MNTNEIVRALKNDAKWVKKISWANALTPGSAEFIAVSERITGAADLIESMQAQLAKPQRLNDEPPAYKFYYCESEDSYLLGRRVDNFYYAHWHEGLGFVWDMSRYLPWGEHVVSPATAWKEHTYPSEPKEIAPGEWFSGFIAQRLAASQRRERAAVRCGECKHGEKRARPHGWPVTCNLLRRSRHTGDTCERGELRGPQEAGSQEGGAE